MDLETNKAFWRIVFTVCVIVILMIVYIPSIIAHMRNHCNKLAILLLNIFLGWNFVGWVICLVWSATKTNCNTTKENTVNNAVDESLDDCVNNDNS